LWLLLPDRRDVVAADAAYADHPEQPLGKTGLMYWTGIMGRSAAIPLRVDFLKNIAPPHFYSFAPNRLLSRSGDCGLAALRHFGASGVIGARRSSRTHFLLLVLMLIFAVRRYGRRLALDAIIVARWRFGAHL
jgi:hypothetical protein